MRGSATRSSCSGLAMSSRRSSASSSNAAQKRPSLTKSRLDDIAAREGWGEISATKLIAAIDERRRIPLDRFINALGIPQVGQATARLLARHYRSLAHWRYEMEAAQDPESPARAHLLDVHGIGADMAADIIGFFAEPH